MSNNLNTNISTIQANIQKYNSQAQLIAISKYVDSKLISQAYNLGHRHFGENKIQIALDKINDLNIIYNCSDIQWHYIGHLQSNKIRKAVCNFQYIHSVDSLKLLQKILHISKEENKFPKLLLQIKLIPDDNKDGWAINNFQKHIDDIACLYQYTDQIIGLMTILPRGLNLEQSQDLYMQLNSLQASLNTKYNWNLTDLSMGMSQDYIQALQSGATFIRVGTAIWE